MPDLLLPLYSIQQPNLNIMKKPLLFMACLLLATLVAARLEVLAFVSEEFHQH